MRKIPEFFDLRSSRFKGAEFNAPGVRGLETAKNALAEPLREGGTLAPSLGAVVPRGCFLDLKIAVRIGGEWGTWFSLVRWTGENQGNIRRTSYGEQRNWFGSVDANAYRNTSEMGPVTHWCARIELCGDDDRLELNWMTLQAANPRKFVRVSAPLHSSSVYLEVPVESQYAYEGGHDWNGAICAAGVLRHFNVGLGLQDPVGHAVKHLIDDRSEGTGNRQLLSGHLSTRLARVGLRAYARNFSSLAEAEFCLRDGFPVIASVAWDNTSPDPALHLPGGIPKTDDHLLVIVGVDDDRILVMDPATTDYLPGNVARAYPREAFERRWIDSTNGAVIAIGRL